MIKFKEDKNSLLNRINIHKQYGQKDITKWISSFVPRKKNLKILDLACGDGSQTLKILNHLKLKKIKTKILATDSNKKLIDTAKKKNKNKNIEYKIVNFDKSMDIADNYYDVVLCLFGIYYAKNIDKTLKEIKKKINKNGKIILVGPLRDNKIDFNNILENAANKKLPKLIGSSRFDSVIYKSTKKKLINTKIKKFSNVLKIKDKNVFINYTLSSITNKRGVYKKFLKNRNINQIRNNIIIITNKILMQKKYLTISKKVGAIIARK